MRAYKLDNNGFLPEQEGMLTAVLNRLQQQLLGTEDAIYRAEQNKLVLEAAIDSAEAAASGTYSANLGFSTLADAEYGLSGRKPLPGQIENLRTRLQLVDAELKQRNAERDDTTKSIAEYENREEQLPVRGLELARLKRNYDLAEANYRSLLEKRVTAGLSAAMEQQQHNGNFTIVDAPRVPDKPIGPRRLRLCAVGCFLSLILGLGLAIAQEIRANAILGEWELATSLPIFGRVPVMAKLEHALSHSNYSWSRH